MSKLPKVTLSLKQFMLKQEVKNLYRQILRTIKEVPDKNSQKELRDWARSDFEKNKNQTDEVAIKMSMQYAQRCLKELQTSLSLSGHTK